MTEIPGNTTAAAIELHGNAGSFPGSRWSSGMKKKRGVQPISSEEVLYKSSATVMRQPFCKRIYEGSIALSESYKTEKFDYQIITSCHAARNG